MYIDSLHIMVETVIISNCVSLTSSGWIIFMNFCKIHNFFDIKSFFTAAYSRGL